MRLRDHTVVFDRDPDFPRFLPDPSGSVMQILRIWVAEPGSESPRIRHYVGSVRHCASRGWVSHRELVRLFRRATAAALHLGISAPPFRMRLSDLLRQRFPEARTSHSKA
jgi:hypothetical protein